MMPASWSAIIRYFAPKSPSFMLLGACRLKKFDRTRVAFLPVLLLVAAFSLVSCGGASGPTISKPPSGVTTRVLASQSVASPTAFPGLVIVDGEIDVRIRAASISAGSSPGLMAISPDRQTVIAFNSAVNSWAAEIVSTPKEAQTGSISLPGPTTSMVALDSGFGYAAVPSAPFEAGPSPGAVVVMNLAFSGGIAATLSVPNAQTIVSSPDGTQLLVFSGESEISHAVTEIGRASCRERV